MDKQKAERFAQYLVSKYGEDGAKKKIQKIQKTGKVDQEDLKGFAESEQKSKGKTSKDLHGAKLNYIKTLKHQCADDEELVYYKKGGKVDCGCKKKENGGEIKKAQSGTVANFKEDQKKKQQQNQQQQKPKWTDTKDSELKKLSEKKTLTPQEKQRLQQLRNEFKNSSNTKDYEVEEGKKGMKVEKDCGGSSVVKKFKLARCGSKMKKK